MLVAYRIFIALLPHILESDGEQQRAIVRELKMVLYRYRSPMTGANGAAGTLIPET